MLDKMSIDIEQCIKSCWACRDSCQKIFFTHCLKQGGAHVEAEHVKIMMSCIDICQLTADAMTRGTPVHKTLCHACAEICTACAESCHKISDNVMQECVDICKQCAASCQAMSKNAAASV